MRFPRVTPMYANFAKSVFASQRQSFEERRKFSSRYRSKRTVRRRDTLMLIAQRYVTHTSWVSSGMRFPCTLPAANKFCGRRFLGQTAMRPLSSSRAESVGFC